jgi:hypothetical protein
MTMPARKIGDPVFVTSDNYGSRAIIIAYRESEPDVAPVSHYKVRTDTGDEFWAFDFEISDAEQVARVHQLFMQKLAAEYPDHPWVKKEGTNMPAYDSTQDTLDHIAKVKTRIEEITTRLNIRAIWHDRSKLSEPEKSGYDALTIALKDCVYGSDEYRAALAEAKPVIDHHYKANSHHPEHWESGIAGMSLLDLVEMLADWKGASERTKQGSIAASLAHNKERFGIDAQLAHILENTVKELGW